MLRQSVSMSYKVCVKVDTHFCVISQLHCSRVVFRSGLALLRSWSLFVSFPFWLETQKSHVPVQQNHPNHNLTLCETNRSFSSFSVLCFVFGEDEKESITLLFCKCLCSQCKLQKYSSAAFLKHEQPFAKTATTLLFLNQNLKPNQN